MIKMYLYLQSKMKDQKGQTMVEYALMIVLVALVVALSVPTVTDAIKTSYGNIATALATTPAP